MGCDSLAAPGKSSIFLPETIYFSCSFSRPVSGYCPGGFSLSDAALCGSRLLGIKNARVNGVAATNVRELDELLEFLEAKEQSLLRQQAENVRSVVNTQENNELQADITAYRTFIEQISTLSKAERLVFALYIKGQKSSEIAANRHLSINTMRTHNRNIYAKLNVSSYKELMVYIRMMTAEDRETFA